jgi:hypothetical protein
MGAAGAGEGAAAGAGAAAAGAGAGTIAGGIAAPIIAWYLNRSAGSRVNEPVQRTQEIYQGANSLINLLRQGNNPSGYGRLVRDPQVMDYPALTYQSYQNNPIDIGELYNYMHNIGAGGSPGGGNPSWLTDTDIDSLLYQNGISPEQLSQVLGYTPNYNNRNWDSSPDLSVRTQPDTDRNIRMQEQRLTPEDAALMGITPDDPRYYILLDPYYTGRNR